MSRDKQNIKTTDWLIRGIPEEQLEREKREAIKEAEAKLRDRQIEEMAEIICQNTEQDTMWNEIYDSANALYTAGYRKSAEVVIKMIENLANDLWEGELDTLNISVGKRFYNKQEFIAELKKKYTEGGE